MTEAEKPQAPAVGTPEYDAAMVAKFDGAASTEQETPKAERPAHIPEKFWDAEKGEVRVEDLAKSYAELEKNKGKPAEQPKVADKAPEGEQPDAEKALADKGLDYDSFSKEFQDAGELSEDSYKKLSDAGIPKNMVDAYIEGQRALATQWTNTTYEVAGGQEQYHKMVGWAAENLSHDEKVAFNESISGNEAQMKLAVSGLKQKYESTNGKSPSLFGGGNSVAASGYQSAAQMTADMRDPRYAKDPAFRKQVESRIANSNIF